MTDNGRKFAKELGAKTLVPRKKAVPMKVEPKVELDLGATGENLWELQKKMLNEQRELRAFNKKMMYDLAKYLGYIVLEQQEYEALCEQTQQK